jgi:16S rRNA (guanine527-N7)-methyltransferase
LIETISAVSFIISSKNEKFEKMDRLIVGAQRLGLSLTPEQVERFQVYYEELVRWNRRVNLTAIVDYEEVQVKHFLDSLTVASILEGMPSPTLDIGAGGGLPGVPLKILYPSIGLTLVDSVHKKAAFLHHLIEVLGLEGVEILAERAEHLAHDERYRQRFELVLSRGVARLATLAELALPFCSLGGAFIAMKKGRLDEEIEEAMRALDILGGRLREVKRVGLEEFERDGQVGQGEFEKRALVIIDKLAPTPQRYPRRSGIPRKRPL